MSDTPQRYSDNLARAPIAVAAAFAVLLCGASETTWAADSASSPQSATDPTPQRDLRDVVDAILGRTGERDVDPQVEEEGDEGDTRFFVFPTFGGNPALGFSAGALATLTNYLGDPTATTLSSLLVSASFTTKKQVLLVARSDFYTETDTWHLTGDWRYYDFTERSYGLGSDREKSSFVDVAYDWYRIHQVVYRPLWSEVEVGVGYHLDSRRGITLTEEGFDLLAQAGATEVESTTSSGVSLNVVFDRRDHPLNAERGVYGRASYAFDRTALGSDSDWDSLQLEGRAYHRLPSSRRQVVALWGVGWLTRAGRPTYFELPSVGWDTYGRSARGYTAGRFRGRDWVYTEVEYRADLSRSGLLGAVAFVNASRFSDFTSSGLQRWVPAGGAGLRIKLDKHRRSNVAIDLAWGREGSKGLYLALNEAF